MDFRPGDPFYIVKTTSGANGGLAAPDALPTCFAIHNNVVDGGLPVTVTLSSTGIYVLSGTVPTGYVAGDMINLVMLATIGGVNFALPVQPALTVGKTGQAVAALATEPGESWIKTLVLLRSLFFGNTNVLGNTETFLRADGVTQAGAITVNPVTNVRSAATIGTLS